MTKAKGKKQTRQGKSEDKAKSSNKETEDQIYSATHKVNRVENFDWHYNIEIGKKQIQKEIKDIEAIYINPKWRPSKVGEFLTKPGDGDKKRKLS